MSTIITVNFKDKIIISSEIIVDPESIVDPDSIAPTEQITTENLMARIKNRFGDNGFEAIREKSLKRRAIKTYHGNTHKKNFSSPWKSIPAFCDIDWLKEKLDGGHYTLEDECFQFLDFKYGITKELLKAMAEKGCSVTIRTRSDLVAYDEYVELLKKLKSVKIKLSIPKYLDDKAYRKKFPGAPSLKRLKEAETQLKKSGLLTSTTTTTAQIM